MPNYTMQTRRFDIFGFILLAAGMATLTLALDGKKGWGFPPGWRAGGYRHRRHAGICGTPAATPALFSLNLFRNRTFSLGLAAALPDASAAACCRL
jgi:DHA2 family multidrug resistance protein-like MFS transporter